jgi:hypothetical protein
MEPMSPTAAITKPARAKPLRWKRTAFTIVHYAAGIVVGLGCGVCTFAGLEWLVAAF